MKNPNFNAPNILSASRIIAFPLLLALQIQNNVIWFLIVFVLAGATDFLDGFLARVLNQKTELGKKLDSIADTVFYIGTIYFFYVIFPEIIKEYRLWINITLVFYAVYLTYPLLKFRKLKMMHTRILRLSAVCVYFAMIIAFFPSVIPAILVIAVALTIAMSIVGFIESITIFCLYDYDQIDPDTLSLSYLLRHKKM